MITAIRHHDISCGHRVVGHENKCRFLHGHNYRFHFEISAQLNDLGMVLDFGDIKKYLCEFLEQKIDHKFIVWDKDPMLAGLLKLDIDSIYIVDFNPTAENLAKWMVEIIAPQILPKHTKLISCRIEETRKCSAKFKL